MDYIVGDVFVYAKDGELTIFNDKYNVSFPFEFNVCLEDVKVSELNIYIEKFYQAWAMKTIKDNYIEEYGKDILNDNFRDIVAEELRNYGDIFDFTELVRWYKEEVIR